MVASCTEPQHAYDSMPGRPLDAVVLGQMRSRIYSELQGQLRAATLQSNRVPRATMIAGTLHKLFGEGRSKAEQRCFFLFAAPLMRVILLHYVSPLSSIRGVPSAQLQRSLRRLEIIAPHLAQMIDLHYFAGFSLVATGELLGKSQPELARDLRFVRAWLTNAPALTFDRSDSRHTQKPTKREEPT